MKTIEEEIKQETFVSYQQKAVLSVLVTANWIRLIQGRLFKKQGISPEQYNVLRILRGQRGAAIGVNGIQERMLDKNSNASRLIDKLVEKKLVDRKGCPNDRRQVEVFITEAGKELLATLDVQVNNWEKESALLSQEEAEQLNQLLNKLRITFN
jgi:DNA-binding MarR family transcriptional regulator